MRGVTPWNLKPLPRKVRVVAKQKNQAVRACSHYSVTQIATAKKKAGLQKTFLHSRVKPVKADIAKKMQNHLLKTNQQFLIDRP